MSAVDAPAPHAPPPPPRPPAGDDAARREAGAGVLYALAAYGTWGLCPIYFKAVAPAGALETLGHRVVWGVLLLAGMITAGRRWGETLAAIRRPRTLVTLLFTTALIAGNWWLFIWAVGRGMVLEASLGYFINPLVSVGMGVLLLKERLSRTQGVAIALAGVGVLLLALSAEGVPWVSLGLAGTFACYGLLRKRVGVGALPGLMIETAVMLPAALVLLWALAARGEGDFLQGSRAMDLLLLAAGPVTVIPLLWFTQAARRVRLSTLGVLQYIAPTGQFLLAALVYGERFTAAHAVTFACIWAGLGLFTAESLSRVRRERAARPYG